MISMSTPSISSRLSGEASYRAGKGRIGRRLAYRPSSARRRNKPCSGRTAPGSFVSHLGPPSAPRKTASEALTAAIASSVIATPWRSIAAPPAGCSSKLRSSATAFRTWTAAAATSGPIPSPGRRAMFGISWGTLQIQSDRTGALTLRLVGVDVRSPLERERDVVEAVEQPVPAVGVELERDRAPGEAHLERLEVDLGLPRLHQRAHLRFCEHDRQQADLGAVGEEDVREARRDDRLEPVVLERPGRVFAAGPAAEVRPGGQDRVLGQRPARLLRPVVEEELAEARPLDALEELLGNDLVRVDVGARQRGHRARDHLHGFHQLHSRMSTKWPSIAAAAAICGDTRWVRPPRAWRPSQLRFDVEAQRWPGSRMSGFMPRHIEQPAVRQSKPAARKTSSRPSRSACLATCWEPGTTIASTCAATRPA